MEIGASVVVRDEVWNDPSNAVRHWIDLKGEIGTIKKVYNDGDIAVNFAGIHKHDVRSLAIDDVVTVNVRLNA